MLRDAPLATGAAHPLRLVLSKATSVAAKMDEGLQGVVLASALPQGGFKVLLAGACAEKGSQECAMNQPKR